MASFLPSVKAKFAISMHVTRHHSKLAGWRHLAEPEDNDGHGPFPLRVQDKLKLEGLHKCIPVYRHVWKRKWVQIIQCGHLD